MLIKNLKHLEKFICWRYLGKSLHDKGYSFVAMKTFDLINK